MGTFANACVWQNGVTDANARVRCLLEGQSALSDKLQCLGVILRPAIASLLLGNGDHCPDSETDTCIADA